MICPYCQQKMKEGTLITSGLGNTLFFQNINPKTNKDVFIKIKTNGLFSQGNKSYFCTSCQKIITELEKE